MYILATMRMETKCEMGNSAILPLLCKTLDANLRRTLVTLVQFPQLFCLTWMRRVRVIEMN